MSRKGARLATLAGVLSLAAAPLLPAFAAPDHPAHAQGPHARAAAGATARPKHARVHDSKEAWYASSAVPSCTLPVGCLPAPGGSAAYPKGTLHVGVQLGQESARSYVVPALDELPQHAVTTSGILVLPVDTSSGGGTTNASTAKIQACLVTGRVTDGVDGSTKQPPATDCRVHAAAAYDTKRQVFTVNLRRLLAAWRSGTAYRGIALLPVTAGDLPTQSWQVSFDGRSQKHPVTALLGYRLVSHPATTPGSSPGNSQPPPAPAQQNNGGAAAGLPPVPSGGSLPGPATVSPPAAAPQVAGQPPGVAPPANAAAPVALTGHGFAYPTVFLLPLVLLAGVVFFVRTFTGNPLPLTARGGERR